MNIFHAVRDILTVSVVAHIRLLECSWSIVLGNERIRSLVLGPHLGWSIASSRGLRVPSDETQQRNPANYRLWVTLNVLNCWKY